jgi:hypothetical protein
MQLPVLAAAHGDAQWLHVQATAFHAAFEVEAQGQGAGAGVCSSGGGRGSERFGPFGGGGVHTQDGKRLQKVPLWRTSGFQTF